MKKKTQPKPTQVSKHNAGYSFQIRAGNLAPLPTNVQNVRSYNPDSSLVQTSHFSSTTEHSRAPPMMRPQSTPYSMQQTMSSPHDDGSFTSSHYGMSAGGLSTDGHGIYEESSQLSRPSVSGDNLYAMQKANVNREKNVRSAPASMPGSMTNSSSTVPFKKTDTSQLGGSIAVAEADELDWLFRVILESTPQPIAPSRKPSAARSRPSSSAPKAKAAPALHFDSFLLHLVDKDLQHSNEIGFPEVENEPWAPPAPTFLAEGENETDEYSQDGFENPTESDMWSKSFKGASSKSYLAKGSVLALIDDHKHDTSHKHSPSAGEEFFEHAAKKATAVGLEEMADKIAPSRSRKAQFQEFPGGSEVLTFSDDSRPASPNNRVHSRGESGGNDNMGLLVAGGDEVSWDDAFESDFEPVSFDPEMVRKSKSLEPTSGVLPGGSIKVKARSRPGTADSATIEEIMKDIVDVEEEDGSPFKNLKPGRRRSFGDIAVVEEPTASAKVKSVKYFSYLNMNNTQSQKSSKFRAKSPGSGDDEFDSALKAVRNNNLVVHVADPFENARRERRNSSPHFGALGTPKNGFFGSDSQDPRTQSRDSAAGMQPSLATTPQGTDPLLTHKASNPSNDGPVWGQIPNYSSKPSRNNVLQQSFTVKQGSTRARTAEPSTGSSRGPVIIGHIKKFQFQGESTKSPFLHHMTKDKHLKKYGDDQRAERERAARIAVNNSQKETPSEVPQADTLGSRKVGKTKKTRADRSVLSMSMSALPTLREVAKFEPTHFDTQIEKPKNPFLRQNSWERDPSQPDLTHDVPFSRKPFFGQQGGSSDKSASSFYEDSRGTTGKHNPNPSMFRSDDAVEGHFDSASWGDSFDHEGYSETLGFSSSPTSKGGRGSLSRQPSLVGDAGRPHPLSRQNSLTASALPPIGASGSSVNGNGKVVNEMQALINSINSVLVPPVPLKHNRPVDVFGRGLGGSGSEISMGDGSYHSSPANSYKDSLSGSPVRGMLSRGNSLRSLHSPATSPPAPQGKSASTWGTLRVAIGEEESPYDSNPNLLSRTYSSTAPLAFSSSAPQTLGPSGVSDTVLKYVPSERRGSFLGETNEGLTAKDVLQRRKSNASLLSGPIAADIDKLVSARRDSFLVRPDQSPPLVKATNTSTRSLGNSIESHFQNPLMEEYYDYEQGLQDTGIIIANLHADPLYRILREEIERQQSEENALMHVPPHAVPRAHSARPTHQTSAAIHSAPIPRPLSSRPPKPTAAPVPAPVPRPTRSANGLSNYKNRVLGTVINPADLKVLSSFHSLPSAGWVTCRVVYFLLLSFYECVTRLGKHYEYRHVLKAEALWKVLEQHITERGMCMEEVDYQYSWPVLQGLLAKFPVVITRILGAIELGLAEDDAKSIPEFPASIFFDSFPPTKLVYLRDLIKQGMGLFQASELIHMIPVAAQLCDWSKRVIAHIYASCISRLRATQSHTAKVSSVLHSTVPVYNPAEDGTLDPTDEEDTDDRPATLPPNFKFVLAVEDALEEAALFAMQSQDSFSNMDGSQMPTLALSHTLEKGLNLVKPSDRLDLLLVPPPLREIHSQLSMYGGGVSLNEPFYDDFGSQLTQEGDPLVRLQNDWLLMKHLHERHLQQYAASPLHQVILLPPPHSLYTTVDSYSGTSQVEFDLQTRLDEFIQSQISPAHLQASQNVPRSVLFNLRAKGVHPILEHSVTAAMATGGITQHPLPHARAEPTSTQADVVITRLRDGKLPAFVQRNVLTAAGSLRIAEHESLMLRFSLVLIDDQAPQQRRPLSPFTASYPMYNSLSNAHSGFNASQTVIDQAVASTVGPNKFVVCIADTVHSWLAFQMVCRMAKPSDSIMLIHLPVITPPFGNKVDSQASHASEESMYVTKRQYDKQRAKCQHRIEHLLAVYKNVGYNLWVDKIPTYREEMSRQLAFMQRKSFFHAQLLSKADKGVQEDNWKASGAKSVKHDSSGDVAVRLFVQNQHSYHLATRLLAVAQKHDPTFLVLGAEGPDILNIFTSSTGHNTHHNGYNGTDFVHQPSKEGTTGSKNLNFPYDSVVKDNSRDPPALSRLMSAGNKNTPPVSNEELQQWMRQFHLYADQRIDLVEMVLHLYSNECAVQNSASTLRALSSYQNDETEREEKKRFSFIISNSDCLK